MPISPDRRAQILAAARALALREGVSALTVRAVSAEAGIGVGTLRHYFPSQRELVGAVVAQLVTEELDESVVLDRAVPPGDRLVHGVLQFLPDSLDEPGGLDRWFAFYAAAVSSSSPEHTRLVLSGAVTAAHERMGRWLGILADDGLLDPGDVEDASAGLIALLNGLMLEALTPGSPVTTADARRIAERAARALTGGADRAPTARASRAPRTPR